MIDMSEARGGGDYFPRGGFNHRVDQIKVAQRKHRQRVLISINLLF